MIHSSQDTLVFITI